MYIKICATIFTLVAFFLNAGLFEDMLEGRHWEPLQVLTAIVVTGMAIWGWLI